MPREPFLDLRMIAPRSGAVKGIWALPGVSFEKNQSLLMPVLSLKVTD